MNQHWSAIVQTCRKCQREDNYHGKKKAVEKVAEKAAEVKEAVKETATKAEEAAKETVEKAAEKATEAAAEVKETAEKAVEKAAETVEKTAEAAKTTAKKTATKAKAATTKKATAAKKTVKAKADAVKTETKKRVTRKPTKKIVLQYLGKEFDEAELTERAIAQFNSVEGGVAVKTITMYLKPEEDAAYYVINDQYTGRVDF